MSKEKNKEEVIQHKKQAIRKLNNLLEEYILSGDRILFKKADLISYWIETFSLYVGHEDSFEASRLIRYSRGDVIRLNFGFNIGKEFGGLHYAVVIDNDNKRNADVLTVVPLSSTDGKKVHNRSVDLGSELFEKINAVQENLLRSARQELEGLRKTQDALNTTIDVLKNYELHTDNLPPEIVDKLAEAIRYQSEISEKKLRMEKSIANIERNNYEISKLKIGSMAITNQITTVSKQRIFTPKRSEDFLYGISLSSSAMDKINSKLKELYIFD
jgi:mRNA-degrading endonuclease toxin of MazEF toxin-antitoxin module